jgi:hypothetical protein
VTSFAASKSFGRSVDAINAHDMTVAGDASFNGGIFLVAAAVDRALKGSMIGRGWTRVLEEKWGRRGWVEGFKRREPLFSSEFYCSIIWTLISQWVEYNGKRPGRNGLRGRPGSQEVWPAGHTLSLKILGFFPRFHCKSLNSLLPLILEIWKENFKKKIFEKGNPNLVITTLFRSRNLWM